MAGMGIPLIDEAIENAIPILTEELIALKRSYFTPQGKDGWAPLAPRTLKNKQRDWPGNASSFNKASGALEESLKVTIVQTESGISINVNFEHQDGDEVIEYLTQELGRDFLNFDDKEKEWLQSRFGGLLVEYIEAHNS
jgi:hypothetical protein